MLSNITASARYRSNVCNWFVIATVLIATAGCDRSPDPAPRKTIDTSPQAKFDRVVAALRSGLETNTDSDSGRYTFRDGAGAGSAQYSYTVHAPEKITLPTNSDSLPRATITILQSSSYTSLPSSNSKSDEESDSKADRNKNARSSSGLSGDQQAELSDMGFEVLDPALVAGDVAEAVAPRIKAPDISTRTITANSEVVYELLFENDRWRMASPPKADTPESTNLAMQLALKRQQ